MPIVYRTTPNDDKSLLYIEKLWQDNWIYCWQLGDKLVFRKEEKNYRKKEIEVLEEWEQALVVYGKEWINEVIQTIKQSVEEMQWVYRASTKERFFANHIAERHKDWWQFLEKRKDGKGNLESIREIIYFSLDPNNSYVKQIINAEDFWNKWAEVVMAMRKKYISKQKVDVMDIIL